MNKGFTEAKLKPVFLLLSGCELDLAIRARQRGDLAASQQHYNTMQMWMHKVYGTSLSATLAQPPNSLLSSATSHIQDPPEPSQLTHAVEVDFSPAKAIPESLITRKRKVERNPPEERNVRRRHSGPPRVSKRGSRERGRPGNKENWRNR